MHLTDTSLILHSFCVLTRTLSHFKQTVYQSISIRSINLVNQKMHVLSNE